MIKDEFKPLQEGVKNASKDAVEIKQLRACLKDKDKRIRVMEDRWNNIKIAFLLVASTISTISIIALMCGVFYLIVVVPNSIMTQSILCFFSIIGFIVCLFGLIYLLYCILDVDPYIKVNE